MKRITSLLLALAVALSLSSCGGNTAGEEGPDFQRGTTVGQTYSSQFLGATVTLDDDWYVADDKQLAELGGTVIESFDSEEVREQLEQGGAVYDLYALRQSDNASLNINIQKIGFLGSAIVSEEAYAEANLTKLPDVLATAGIHVDQIEKTTVTFAGSEHAALTLSATVKEDIPVYETVVVIKVGSYVACVTAASFEEDVTSELLSLFEAL